jgi:hypothetical protein
MMKKLGGQKNESLNFRGHSKLAVDLHPYAKN